MNAAEVAKKLGGEEVGGRVSVLHEGKRQYVMDIVDGHAFLNELGVMLIQAAHEVDETGPFAQEEVVAEKPARKGRKPAAPAADEITIDVE